MVLKTTFFPVSDLDPPLMPPKKRASSGSKPAAKVPTPEPVCYYASKTNPCPGRLEELEEAYTKRKVHLCERHRSCRACNKDVEDGTFVAGRQVYCVLPKDTPNRENTTCAFRCGDCKQFFIQNRLSEVYDWMDPEDDDELFCDECFDECYLCEEVAHVHAVRRGTRLRSVCWDCEPAADAVSVTILNQMDRV